MKLEVVVIGLLGLLHASTSRADESEFSSVVLLDMGCPIAGLGNTELRAAVASELAASSLELAAVDRPATATDVTVTIRLPCSRDADLTLTANWHDSTLERTLKIADLSDASRARALALVVAELLAQLAERRPPTAGADSATHTGAAAPPPEPDAVYLPETLEVAQKPAKRVLKVAAPRAELRRHELDTKAVRSKKDGREAGSVTDPWSAGAGPEIRAFFGGPTLFGVDARLNWGTVTVGVSVLGGNTSVLNGTLSAIIAHGTASVRALTIGSSSRVSLSLGPRVGLGYLAVSAEAQYANVVATTDEEPYADAAGFASFAFHASEAVRIDAAAELGAALGMKVFSDSSEAANYGGPFVSALIDVSLQLGD